MAEHYERSQEDLEWDLACHEAYEEWLDNLTPVDLMYCLEWRWEWALTDPHEWYYRGENWERDMLYFIEQLI